MTATELAAAEKRLQQKWYDLIAAEQNGAEVPVLERLHNAYMLAVEEYNRCLAIYQREQRVLQAPTNSSESSHPHHRRAS